MNLLKTSEYIVTSLEYSLGLDRVNIVSVLHKLVPGDEPVIVHVNPPEGQLYPVLLWYHWCLATATKQPSRLILNQEWESWWLSSNIIYSLVMMMWMMTMTMMMSRRVFWSLMFSLPCHVNQLSLGPKLEETLSVDCSIFICIVLHCLYINWYLAQKVSGWGWRSCFNLIKFEDFHCFINWYESCLISVSLLHSKV